MKREERIAHTYLLSLGFKDVVYEPDGNIPPDFSLDGSIGVEVRRLNQHDFTRGAPEGLEVTRQPLFDLLAGAALHRFDTRYSGRSFWVSFSIRRPIATGMTIRHALAEALERFLQAPPELPSIIRVTKGVYLNVSQSCPVDGRVFRFAGGTDRQSGGFVVPEVVRNLNYCIAEKAEKIKDYRHKYDPWWLILVDRIAYGLDEDDRRQIITSVCTNPTWARVIVLNDSSGRCTLEV